MNSKEMEQALKRLESSHPSVREGAILELQKRGDERALVPLQRLRNSNGSFWMDNLVSTALKMIKEHLIKKLIQSQQWNPLLKSICIWFGFLTPKYTLKLARNSGCPLYPYLIIALFWGGKKVRVEAVTGLGELAGEESADALLIALCDDDADVRELALSQLKKISSYARNPILKELSRDSCGNKITLISILGELRDLRVISPLIDMLGHDEQAIRKEAAKALIRFKAEAANPLIDAINQSKADPSPETVKAFRELSQYMTIAAISQMLKDPRFMVRMEAVAALGSSKRKSALDLLLKALKDHEPAVRAQAAFALRQAASPRGVEPLIKMLQDPDPAVRDEAAATLGVIGDKRAIEPLAGALAAGHFKDLPNTAVALSRFGDTRALQPLFNLVWSGSSKIRETQDAFDLLQSRTSGNVSHGICEKCLVWSNVFRITPLNRGDLLGMSIKYIACKNCNSNLYLSENIKHIIWVLDRRMTETTRPAENNDELEVNAFKHKDYVDFDEIRITDADDYQVEKFVMRLLDDMDESRRSRYPHIPVYLSPTLTLSPAKINLLDDHFNVYRTTE